jgi:ribosomal protein L37E
VSTPLGNRCAKDAYSDELLQALHIAVITPGKFIAILWIRYLCPRVLQFQGKAPASCGWGSHHNTRYRYYKRSSRHRPDERRRPSAATSLSFWASAADMATLCDEQGRGTITNRAPMTVCSYCGFPGFVLPYLQSQIVYLVPALQHVIHSMVNASYCTLEMS